MMAGKAYGVVNVTVKQRKETRTVQGGIQRTDHFADAYLDTGELLYSVRLIVLDASELVKKRSEGD